MEDAQAIAMLKDGDLKGMESLVHRYQVQAVQTAYLIVGDRPSAEDISQTAFLRAAEKIHHFKDGRPFRPWFLRIVTNEAIKTATRSRKQYSLEDAQEGDAIPSWLRDPTPGPEEQANREEEKRRVWLALAQLTPKERSAIVLRYFLGMRDREISQVLKRSLASIKWSIHAGKGRLRSLLGGAHVSEIRNSSQEGDEGGAGGKP
jgi:RNA polymerase sigma-70 factor (ECF subfamily)